ncbi:RHS repeat-associated core domain-containing protein [Streptomyces sp. NPDC008121]|uniref:RHS repeat-associated core domain-containing protein n=1 Tax=Streptomyces sp. NPDC008121 TaxID=3364809 RepID=UPI0036E42036
MALATAVVMAVTAVPAVTAGAAVAAGVAGGAGVSGSVALGGGASGSISEQTGAFTTVLPLVSLPGRAGAGVELGLAYSQGAAGAGADRHGLGQGIGLGKAFIDPESGGTLHTASGGSYQFAPGDKTGTGLRRYLLQDLALRDQPGTLPARDGLEGAARDYRWVLAYDDGRKSYFSAEGDLIAEVDAFGNEAAYVWEIRDGQHRLVKAVDAYGQAVTLDYGTEGQVTVTSPVRSDGRRPEVVLHLDSGRLMSVVSPEEQVTRLAWDYAPDGMPGRLLTGVEAPTGAVTRISYDRPHGFPVVASLKVTDREGKSLAPERTFRLGAEGEQAGHDFTGRGQYESADDLFDSADEDYRYVTELSDGRSTVRSVYNSLHLLKERTVSLDANGEPQPVRTQELAYEGERENGAVPPPASGLPANYGKPVRATVTVHDPSTGKSRTTTETARFDEHGREVERTDVTGAKTVTAYDPTALDAKEGGDGGGQDDTPAGFGLPLRVTVTGADGAEAVTENTLTGDRKSIAAVKKLVKNKGEKELSARTVTSYQVNKQGEVTGKSLTWAQGAKPDSVQGPDEVSETYESTADPAARTRTVVVKSVAGVSSQVTDLVTGQVTGSTDTEGRTVETAYDEAGREVLRKVPGGPEGDGLLTTVSYTPATTTVSTPGQDGKPHITVEHRDLLGRAVKQTDNVRDGALTDDPAARTLQSVTFKDGGRTAEVTDQAGRTTVTTSDDLGRPVKTVAPNGISRLTVYQDAATAETSAVTTLTLPAGESDPAKAAAVSTETSDNAKRPVETGASFADGTVQSGSRQSYDGLGRVAEAVSQDVGVTPAYGPGGTQESAALTPRDTGSFPGGKVTATMPQDLTGAPVVKTLTPGQDAEGRQGTALVRDAAGRVTEEHRPDGKKTTFSYTPGGQVKESVSPSGIKTAYTYDEDSGQLLEATITSADGKTTEKTGYSYDPHTRAVTAVFNPDDKAGTLIGYTYDADGNTTQVAYPDGKTVRQEFSDQGQLEKATDTAGLTTFYTYNSDGALQEAVQHERDDRNSPVRAKVAYTYDALGRITKTDRGNGVTTETGFTGAHQISREKTTRGGEVITEASYLYDSHGSLTQRTDTRPGTDTDGAPGEPVSTTTRYTYDAYNRLTGSEVLGADGQKLSSTRYELNVSGDVVKTETTPHTGDQAAKTAVTGHGIDTSGRLNTLTVNGQERAQVFDTDGNLTTSQDGTVWTYGLHGRPVTSTASDGTVTRYTYWADGTRATAAETTAPDSDGPAGGSGPGSTSARQEQTTRFYYSPDGAILNDTHTTTGTDGSDAGTGEDAAPGAAVTASYLMAGTRHARTLTGQGAEAAAATGAGYLIADRHGNTTALTAGDGQVSQAWQYTDYGQPARPDGLPRDPGAPAGTAPAGAARQPFTYAGEYTGAGGTQYLKARLYDTATGRFTTPDPAPQHNRYQAFGANPVTNIDPEGTTEIPDWGGYLIMGLTLAAAVITTVITVATAGAGAPLAFALAGAALDFVSTALDTAAMATGRTQIDDPLNIASLTLGAIGIATGIGAAAKGITKKLATARSVKLAANTPPPAAVPLDQAIVKAKEKTSKFTNSAYIRGHSSAGAYEMKSLESNLVLDARKARKAWKKVKEWTGSTAEQQETADTLRGLIKKTRTAARESGALQAETYPHRNLEKIDENLAGRLNESLGKLDANIEEIAKILRSNI